MILQVDRRLVPEKEFDDRKPQGRGKFVTVSGVVAHDGECRLEKGWSDKLFVRCAAVAIRQEAEAVQAEADVAVAECKRQKAASRARRRQRRLNRERGLAESLGAVSLGDVEQA